MLSLDTFTTYFRRVMFFLKVYKVYFFVWKMNDIERNTFTFELG